MNGGGREFTYLYLSLQTDVSLLGDSTYRPDLS